jgi:hypothetical protein
VIGTAKVTSYEDLVQAQKMRDAKDAGRGGEARGSTKRKRATSKPAAGKRPRKSELEGARQEIEAMGLGDYCSVLQFAGDELG